MFSSKPGSTRFGGSTLWIVANVSRRSKVVPSLHGADAAGLLSESVLERGSGDGDVTWGLGLEAEGSVAWLGETRSRFCSSLSHAVADDV